MIDQSVKNTSAMTGLSPAQIEQFRVEGYVVVPAFFGGETLAAADAAIAELTQQALAPGAKMEKILELEPVPVDGKRVPRRIYNPYKAHRAFHDMATAPALLDLVQSLIGPDFSLHHGKLNMKPARVGSVVEWHQDLAYFPHTNDSLVSLLIYLDAADTTNGCLQVIPRQHHHYFNHLLPDGSFTGMVLDKLSDGRYGRPVELAGPAGSVILMHGLTPHSSLPNRSDRGRRTLIFEYRAADAYPIYTGDLTVQQEATVEVVRGKATRQARFGGPAPIVPNFMTAYKSLYDSQEKGRKAMEGGRKG